MKDGTCSTHYLKNFNKTLGDYGYPKYMTCSPKGFVHMATINMRRNTGIIDNKWIVPHNSALFNVFHAHINIEYCS